MSIRLQSRKCLHAQSNRPLRCGTVWTGKFRRVSELEEGKAPYNTRIVGPYAAQGEAQVCPEQCRDREVRNFGDYPGERYPARLFNSRYSNMGLSSPLTPNTHHER